MNKKTMLKHYRAYNKAESFFICFSYNNNIYFIERKYLPLSILKVDRASRNGGNSLRVSITIDKKRKWSKNAILLCNESEIETGKYNKGENVERKIFAFFNREWKKDNTPFYVSGDIEINGRQIQIKYENATCINEKQIKRLRKKLKR